MKVGCVVRYYTMNTSSTNYYEFSPRKTSRIFTKNVRILALETDISARLQHSAHTCTGGGGLLAHGLSRFDAIFFGAPSLVFCVALHQHFLLDTLLDSKAHRLTSTRGVLVPTINYQLRGVGWCIASFAVVFNINSSIFDPISHFLMS